jgi:hypothetical protein
MFVKAKKSTRHIVKITGSTHLHVTACLLGRKKEHAQTLKWQHMTQTRKTENHCNEKTCSILFKEPCSISPAPGLKLD